MCGIAGLLARSADDRPSPDAVARMTFALAHRGPDGSGSWEDGPVALGHRRLSIIDLSDNGRQPMTDESGRVAIVVNGEIYNHESLRRELCAKGHVFRSRSDSEVVAHLYEEEGERLLERLRGMFALAVWDRPGQQLLLARDRAGEKPLYYAMRADGLAFASEMGALLADERTPAEIDLAALDAYLALQYVPSPRSIYRHVRKLPPGHFIVVRPGQEPTPRPYWRLGPPPGLGGMAEEDLVREVRRAVEEAVSVRLMSDVPLGAFLSGGLDSSIVVACMARASGEPIRTFSIGFPEARVSELGYARMVAERWRTDHHEMVVHARMIDLLPEVVRRHGEPFADPSAVPTSYVSRLARDHVKVVLSGDGGDECFGGYRRYMWARVAHLLARVPLPLRKLVVAGLAGLPGPGARWYREYGRHLLRDEATRYLRFVGHFSGEERRALYTPELGERLAEDETALRFAERLAESRMREPLARLMEIDAQTYLPDDVLSKVDIASMAYGLEARAPLCDHHVMEIAAAVPARLKLRRLRGKHLLRRAFADVLPDAIRRRGKRGFSLPLDGWFRGDLRGFAHDLLLGARARERGLFRPEAVADLLRRHESGEGHGERLWNLCVLELWFREVHDARAGLVKEAAPEARARTVAVPT